MKSSTATISSKNQITVPASVRDALNVSAHDRLQFQISDGVVTVVRVEPELTISQLAGILPSLGRTSSADFDDEIRDAQEDRAAALVRRLSGT